MSKQMVITVACGFLMTLPALAQDRGGIQLGHQAAMLGQIKSLSPGCPLAKTNMVVGTNRAIGSGSRANQSLSSMDSGCRPLVSTQVVAGVNVAARNGSAANQTLSASAPQGLIATTNFTRGTNVAAGRNTMAQQRLQSLTGP